MVRVFYFDGCYDGTVGGSHTCLVTLVLNLDHSEFLPIVGFYQDHWIARALRDAGVETRILRWSQPVDLASRVRSSGPASRLVRAMLTVIQKSTNLALFLVKALRRAVFLRRERIDLLHLNNSLATNHDWMLGAWLARVKIVSHERGISVRTTGTLRLLSRAVDQFLCVSRLVFDHLEREGIAPARMSVIYDGIDLARFQAVRHPERVREDLGVTSHQKLIGVLGNIREWKGQESIVRATSILVQRRPDLVCLLIGTADEREPYVARIKDIVRDLGLEQSVRLLGFRRDASEILRAMDVVCHTSITPEPFGMVNLEAMYLERPVVSTRLGGPMEVIEDGVDGLLIEPGNPELLAEQIERILGDDNFARQLGVQAKQTVIDRFNARNTVTQIERTYAMVLGTG